MDASSQQTHVIRLSANIGRQKGLWNGDQIQAALRPWHALPNGLDIDLVPLSVSDAEPALWDPLASVIRQRVSAYLQQVASSPVRRICVFGLAPIPLLMVLGEALGEKQEIHVFNRFHEPGGWLWAETQPERSRFQVLTHVSRGTQVALLLSISGKVFAEEAEAMLPPSPCAMYEIAVEEPRRDSIRAVSQLHEFARICQDLLAKIRATHGPRCRIHVFPAVPVAVAIQCGLSLLPKADPAMRIYDHQRDRGGFVATLELLSPGPPLPQRRAEPARALVQFLSDSFDSKDLRLLFSLDDHLGPLVEKIDWSAAFALVTVEVVEVLRKHGKIGPELFAALRKARPARGAEIDEVAAEWGC
ncbi:SAVED domain-containing protein [Nannocystis pusilla]|uniref:SAVED domain-containing protein n=1 Tax=Nannocystis pusilla TaxID=889268 RepID=A0ABS7TZT7_9BACT|nr:SAVED domain-containing protein [Nannocystis pusilla]MBZ5713787.1 SAVED domain-containing protein [Nannocystis pusilla]